MAESEAVVCGLFLKIEQFLSFFFFFLLCDFGPFEFANEKLIEGWVFIIPSVAVQTVKQVILINIHLLPVLFRIYTALHVSQFPSGILVTVAVFQDLFSPLRFLSSGSTPRWCSFRLRRWALVRRVEVQRNAVEVLSTSEHGSDRDANERNAASDLHHHQGPTSKVSALTISPYFSQILEEFPNWGSPKIDLIWKKQYKGQYMRCFC